MYWVVKKRGKYWTNWEMRYALGGGLWTEHRWQAQRWINKDTAREHAASINAKLVRVVPKPPKPERSISLARYLEAKLDAKGEFGWVPKYEATITKEPNPAYMCGHYHALLDDLIALIGTWNAARLARAYDAVTAVNEVEA